MNHPNEREARAVAEAHRRATPTAADRERLTAALRARLGTAALPVGLEPTLGGALSSALSTSSGAARAATRLGKSGWLAVVVGTGVVTGALGFALGYGMGQRNDTGGPAPVASPSIGVPVASASVAWSASAPSAAGDTAGEPSRSAPSHAPSPPAMQSAAPGRRSLPAPSGSSGRVGPTPARATWSFADVIERLRRANLALHQGQAPLALIQLSELDRWGGDLLHEEREVTRVLALCAVGDVGGARRVAKLLLTGSGSSLYAPRLGATCALSDVQSQTSARPTLRERPRGARSESD